jgi:hypothetical protein
MVYSRARKTKPATLEIRVMDSNIPEYIIAAACVIKAAALAFLKGKKITNRLSEFRYLRSRVDAARRGMQARLYWNDERLSAHEYLDRFVWVYREELREMDIPQEVWVTLKLLKRGVNGSRIILDAASRSYRRHAPTWERRFAKSYTSAIAALLGGNSIQEFMRTQGVRCPSMADVWLGRKGLKLL